MRDADRVSVIKRPYPEGEAAKSRSARAFWRGSALAACTLEQALSPPRNEREMGALAGALLERLLWRCRKYARMFRSFVLAADAKVEKRNFREPPHLEGQTVTLAGGIGDILGYAECPPGLSVDDLLTPYPHTRPARQPQVNTSAAQWMKRAARRQGVLAETVIHSHSRFPKLAGAIAWALRADGEETGEYLAGEAEADPVRKFVAERASGAPGRT